MELHSIYKQISNKEISSKTDYLFIEQLNKLGISLHEIVFCLTGNTHDGQLSKLRATIEVRASRKK